MKEIIMKAYAIFKNKANYGCFFLHNLPLDLEEKNNEKISMINQNIKAPVSLASNIEINKALSKLGVRVQKTSTFRKTCFSPYVLLIVFVCLFVCLLTSCYSSFLNCFFSSLTLTIQPYILTGSIPSFIFSALNKTLRQARTP